MNPQTKRIIMVLAILLASGSWLAIRKSAPEQRRLPAAAMESTDDRATLVQEVNALRAQIELLHRHQGALADAVEQAAKRAAVPIPGEAKTAPESRPLSEEERRHEAQMAQERNLQFLSGHFGREAKDSSWAATMEYNIAQSFKGEAAQGSTPRVLECRTHLCRLEVIHQDKEARKRLFAALSSALPYSLDVFSDGDGDGGQDVPNTIIFLSRPGQAMPEMTEVQVASR